MWVCVGCSWVRRRLCVRVGRGQARLMGALDSIIGALDAHRGVTNVVASGLQCLVSLSAAEATQVRGLSMLAKWLESSGAELLR